MKKNMGLRAYRPIVILVGLLLLTCWSVPAIAQDAQKEVGYEAGFYYTVKKGDTLWDISQRFNDTPWHWPDLWKENNQLPNPHWIYPGERIRLYRKKDKHRYQDQAVPQVTPQVEVSTPESEPTPEVQFLYSSIDSVGFIRKPPVKPLGRIFKVQEDKKMISTDDQIYLQPSAPGQANPFAPGQRLTVYRTLNPTKARNSARVIGTQHYLLGIVEITAAEPKYALAKVIKVYREMRIGDLLMAFEPLNPELPVPPSTPGIDGKIIASEEHSLIMGDQSVSFIDKGDNDNIRPGQLYTIYYQETERGTDGRPIKLKPVDIGTVVVLRTEATTSTVYISDALGQIVPGQKVRTP